MYFQYAQTCYASILLGDFNQLKIQPLCDELDMIDIVLRPTRGDNTLDRILISSSLSDVYDSQRVEYDAPVGNSDHCILTITPSKLMHEIQTPESVKHVLYDFRESNLRRLENMISQANWSNIINEKDINLQ